MGDNFLRTYTLKAGQKGKQGVYIGNTSSAEEDCLRISFSVEKSNTETPNNAKIQIWNLSTASIKIFETKNCEVELKAGYNNDNALIIVGTVTSAITSLDNADRVTELTVVDGFVALRDSVISVSKKGKVSSKTIYSLIAKAMGLSILYGNGVKFKNIAKGFSYVGKGKNALQKIAKANGHKWTIQNGVIQIINPKKSFTNRAYVLNANTGLIGSPKRISISTGTQNTNVSGYEINYFLNGAIGINDRVKVESKTVNGAFFVNKLTIDGDNLSGDWQCKAELVRDKITSK